MYTKNIYFSVSFFFFWHTILSQPIVQITFVQDSLSVVESAQNRLKKSMSVGKKGFNNLIDHKPVSGFFASYAGLLGVSDNTGSIIFPRKHTESVLYIAITQEVMPIMRIENTVNHWEFVEAQAASFYKLSPSYDAKNQQLTWNIQELEIPQNRLIPAETIIIFGNPSLFHFDISKSGPAYVTPNIIAPPIVVTKGTSAIRSALYLLSIKHLFASAQPEFKKHTKAFQIIPAQ